MKLEIDKIKLWWLSLPTGRWWRVRLYILTTILVLSGVNIYLFQLRNSIQIFIGQEAELSNKRIELIMGYRK